jgi:hypothetical protein
MHGQQKIKAFVYCPSSDMLTSIMQPTGKMLLAKRLNREASNLTSVLLRHSSASFHSVSKK